MIVVDGRWLLRRHAGCAFPDIIRALGVDARDLFPSNTRRRRPRQRGGRRLRLRRRVRGGALRTEGLPAAPARRAGGHLWNLDGVAPRLSASTPWPAARAPSSPRASRTSTACGRWTCRRRATRAGRASGGPGTAGSSRQRACSAWSSLPMPTRAAGPTGRRSPGRAPTAGSASGSPPARRRQGRVRLRLRRPRPQRPAGRAQGGRAVRSRGRLAGPAGRRGAAERCRRGGHVAAGSAGRRAAARPRRAGHAAAGAGEAGMGRARRLTSAGRGRRRRRAAGRPAGRRRARRCQPRGVRASR